MQVCSCPSTLPYVELYFSKLSRSASNSLPLAARLGVFFAISCSRDRTNPVRVVSRSTAIAHFLDQIVVERKRDIH